MHRAAVRRAPMYERVRDPLAKRAGELPFAWPAEPTEGVVNMPLISADIARRCSRTTTGPDRGRDRADRRGGAGPGRRPRRRQLRAADRADRAGAASRTNTEEIFGPVCHVAPFDSEDEAFGSPMTASTVWPRPSGPATSAGRIARVAALDAGIVWVNTWFLRDLRTPFGGMKASGVGREGGALARLLLGAHQRLRGPHVTGKRKTRPTRDRVVYGHALYSSGGHRPTGLL